VGQSPGGSLARPSRPHLRPGPGEPVRWARPPCGGAPPLGPFRRRLHRPRWGVSLRFTRQAWPQPPGWNHHPKPPAPTGQASWDGEPTWPGTAVAVTLWWPPTLPLRPGAAGWASGIPAGSPLPRGSFWPSPFSFGAPRPADSDTPLPGRPPSRLSGESPRPGPPPRWRRGPLGWKPRVSRSALSQAAGFPGGRFVYRRGYGAPHCSHSRPTQAVSPSPSPWFSLAPRRSMPATVPRATPHG
jgi:hypothetical protein